MLPEEVDRTAHSEAIDRRLFYITPLLRRSDLHP